MFQEFKIDNFEQFHTFRLLFIFVPSLPSSHHTHYSFLQQLTLFSQSKGGCVN